MQAVAETLFDVVYLVSVIAIGDPDDPGQQRETGSSVCSAGWPWCWEREIRSIWFPVPLAFCTTGLENYTVPLGLGKWITSVTMTIFYVLLYYVWRQRYQCPGQEPPHRCGLWAGGSARYPVPDARRTSGSARMPPLSWGIYRNIPFALLGLVVIVLFYRQCQRSMGTGAFRMDVADHCAELWLLYPGGAVG